MADARAAGRLAVLVVGGLSGCAEWPRHAHLPDAGPLLEPGAPLREAVEVAWSTVDVEGYEQPPGPLLGALAQGQGVVVQGDLIGAGWDGAATPLPLTGVACDSRGSRAPYAGDYRGEVEAFNFSVDDTTRLCVRGLIGDDTLSIDAVIRPLDGCDVPGAAVPERGAASGDVSSPAGFAVLGPVIDHAVTLQPGRYTLIFGAYLPDDTVVRPFEIGLSAFPDEDGLCPLLPSEISDSGGVDDIAADAVRGAP